MNSYWGLHASAQKITETTKSSKSCYIIKTNRVHFKIDELKCCNNSE